MTRNNLTVIGFRWSIIAVLALWVFALSAPAQPAQGGKPASIDGVYNGAYTGEKGTPVKFSLTLTRQDNNGYHMGGVLTLELPEGSGTNAYTCDLQGTYIRRGGSLELRRTKWETAAPPPGGIDLVGINGRFDPGRGDSPWKVTGIIGGDRAYKFEAVWDAAAPAKVAGTSADTKEAGASAKSVAGPGGQTTSAPPGAAAPAAPIAQPGDEVAALKARAELIKNAPPKQLAVQGVVRKSQAYWNGYRWDFIRQIFDGGFADDMDEDLSFQDMFKTYVDLFSKNCRADLPAGHRTITIVKTTKLDNGIVVKKESRTIEIDPRFIKKYCEFAGVEPDPGSPDAAALAAKNVQIYRQVLEPGGPAGGAGTTIAWVRLRVAFAHAGDVEKDLNKFFATERGSSAAMRQLGENLLRGAMGEPSLQEAGAKIDGAEAETDKDLPPGRFTHLIDAVNAYYRDPAHAEFRSRYEMGFYILLAEKYRGVMPPEEEYYYANDFVGRFEEGIMGDPSLGERSTDPAWPRLHPAVAQCERVLQR